MLVVVHDGNRTFAPQAVLNLETLGSLDVFQVDAAEGFGNRLHDFDKTLGVFFIDLDVVGIEAGEDCEQQRLAFHNGFGRAGADVAEPEHGSAVGDYGDKVAAVGVLV